MLRVLDEIKAAAKKNKGTFPTFFAKKIQYLRFQPSYEDFVPVERRVESFVKMKQPEKRKDIRSLIGSINELIRFISTLAATTEPLSNLMKNIHNSNVERI